VEAWQKELKSKNAREAYEFVVREDQVEGYQAYLALYPSQSTAPAVRSLSERRQVMVAWYTAVTINTVASYQAFLASYGNSDFAATAERLLERALTRSVAGTGAAFASIGSTCPCSLPTTPTLPQRRTDRAPMQNTGSKGANSPASNVATIDPTPVIPPVVAPPVVVVPPKISVHPKTRDKKPPRGNDHAKSPPETGKGKKSKSAHNNNPPITPVRAENPPQRPKGPATASSAPAVPLGLIMQGISIGIRSGGPSGGHRSPGGMGGHRY
jgi:hypothetical protein